MSLLTYLSRGRELIFPKERLSIVLARVLGKDECLHGEEGSRCDTIWAHNNSLFGLLAYDPHGKKLIS